MQRQIPITGELTPCKCGRQPKHYESLGRQVHHLECSPCGTRTPKMPTFQQAVEHWEQATIEHFSLRAA